MARYRPKPTPKSKTKPTPKSKTKSPPIPSRELALITEEAANFVGGNDPLSPTSRQLRNKKLATPIEKTITTSPLVARIPTPENSDDEETLLYERLKIDQDAAYADIQANRGYGSDDDK
jgi:hypothetical protein